jgi:hypothetical protein
MTAHPAGAELAAEFPKAERNTIKMAIRGTCIGFDDAW